MKIPSVFPQGKGRRGRRRPVPPEPLPGGQADPEWAAGPVTPAAVNDGPAPGQRTPAAPSRQDDAPSPGPGEGARLRGWAPIVVDRAIFEFEPKPPSSQDYRPDTIYDGWSTRDLTIRLASVRGYSHRYKGSPRQDEAAVGFDPRSGTVLFAVADGVSSASQSHIGAAIACRTLVELQKWMLETGRPIDLPQAVTKAAYDINACAAHLLRQENPGEEAVEDLLATTLTAGYIRPGPEGAFTALVQIGDSGAWALRGSTYHPLLGQKNDPDAAVISSAVSPLPRLPAQIVPAEYQLRPDEVLLVGTDGFGDPLGDGDGQVGQLFAGHLGSPPPARGLAHLLDFSRDTFDDDRTLLAIWQRPQWLHAPGNGRLQVWAVPWKRGMIKVSGKRGQAQFR